MFRFGPLINDATIWLLLVLLETFPIVPVLGLP